MQGGVEEDTGPENVENKVVVVSSLDIEQDLQEKDVDPQELREQIRELRGHLRTILDVEERAAAGEPIGPDETVAMQAKATVIYNLMQLTQSLNQLGVEIEKETRRGPVEGANLVRSRRDGNPNGNGADRSPPGRLERARHSVQHAGVATRSSIFGKVI